MVELVQTVEDVHPTGTQTAEVGRIHELRTGEGLASRTDTELNQQWLHVGRHVRIKVLVRIGLGLGIKPARRRGGRSAGARTIGVIHALLLGDPPEPRLALAGRKTVRCVGLLVLIVLVGVAGTTAALP